MKEEITLREALDKYVEMTIWIRELSSPDLSGVKGAEEYREKLLRNFSRIGELAAINGDILERYAYPLLDGERLLTDDEVEDFLHFHHAMQDALHMENLDIPLMHRVMRRLLEDAVKKQDVARLIRELDGFITSSYTIIEMTARFYDCDDSFARLRAAGRLTARKLLTFLEKDVFATLPDEHTKQIVMVNARYDYAMMQPYTGERDAHAIEETMSLLRHALAIMDDPFYREQLPNYDWRYHEYRVLQYFCNLTDYCNRTGLDDAQCREVCGYASRFYELWMSDVEYFEGIESRELMTMTVLRNRYLAGEIEGDDYRAALMELHKNATADQFSFDDNSVQVMIPLEAVLSLDSAHLTAEQGVLVTDFYRSIISYLYRMPKLGNLSFLLTDLSCLLDHFIDVPDGIDFETMCLELMAAVHPPTYVHSLSVADLTVCLTKHLFDKDPALFEGVPGYPDREAVLDFAWHSAVCHDFGKLYIVETIMTYGRSLYDMEFDWIRAHPSIGARLLAQHGSTALFANVAKGHHKWYNDKGGYPADFTLANAKDHTMIEVVTCADCLDASTDAVGRSYKTGRTLDDFIAELKERSGTQYAPYLEELVTSGPVYRELDAILNAGRDENYRRTYRILERV